MRRSYFYFSVIICLLFAKVIYAVPQQCPQERQSHEQTYWLPKEGDYRGGTFVMAAWIEKNHDYGIIECTYARGMGTIISKFQVKRPKGPTWQKMPGKAVCQDAQSINNPAYCRF